MRSICAPGGVRLDVVPGACSVRDRYSRTSVMGRRFGNRRRHPDHEQASEKRRSKRGEGEGDEGERGPQRRETHD